MIKACKGIFYHWILASFTSVFVVLCTQWCICIITSVSRVWMRNIGAALFVIGQRSNSADKPPTYFGIRGFSILYFIVVLNITYWNPGFYVSNKMFSPFCSHESDDWVMNLMMLLFWTQTVWGLLMFHCFCGKVLFNHTMYLLYSIAQIIRLYIPGIITKLVNLKFGSNIFVW